MADVEKPAPNRPSIVGDLFLALVLLMPALDIAAIHGARAETLGIPGAGIVRLAPFGMIFCILGLPWLLHGTRLGRPASAIAFLSAGLVMASPGWLLSLCSTEFPLGRKLSHEESEKLQRVLEVPLLLTYDGPPSLERAHVRTADLTPEVRARLDAWLASLPPVAAGAAEVK
ncbi:MAG: hypothetical protein ACO1TE_16580 [Prosthecobacter sp.]